MKSRVHLETTVISYLTAWPSRDLVMAAHQQITREWWNARRAEFELFVLQLVVQEAGVGDPDAAARRLELLQIPTLRATDAAVELARAGPASAVARACCPQRAAHWRSHRERYGLFADVELQAHRERSLSTPNRIDLPRSGLRTTSALHA